MMHHRKHHHTHGLVPTVSRKKGERRKRQLEIPAFLLILIVGLIVIIGLAVLATVQLSPEPAKGLLRASESLEKNHVTKATPVGQQSKNYHVVFSTSCTAQQHWESYILFYHAWKVKQPGNITRLLSGCSDEDTETIKQFHKKYIATLSPNFFVHFTPDYGKVQHHHFDDKKEAYKYMNKPFSLRHWLENALGYRITGTEGDVTFPLNERYDDDIIFLIDPDMLLIKPLTHDFRDANDKSFLWAEKPPNDEHRIVRHGHPMSQQDGYLSSNWLHFNMTAVTLDPSNTINTTSPRAAHLHWNSGPPYIMTARDAYRIAVHWTWYAPRVHKQFPKLFAEMFGYVIATAYLNLPHTFLKSLVVSTTMTEREGWALVDSLDSVCPHSDATETPEPPLPFVIHYCKRYLLGKAFWSKYRLRKDIMDCAAPLVEVPDPSIVNLRYSISPPPPVKTQEKGGWSQVAHNVSARVAKREAFMLCALTTKTNEAIEYYKRQACGNNGNYSKVYNAHTDPQ